jgi:hypothetical protein
MTTKITSAIWDDPDFMELLDAEKLCIFWVLTKCNLLGWVEATPRKLARDMQAPFKDLEGACGKLPRSFVITPRGVWCRNYIRKQFGYGQSLARSHMSKSLRKQIADAPEEIQKLILQEYPEIRCSSPSSPKELGSSLEATIEGEGEIEGEIEGETLLLKSETSKPETTHPVLTRFRNLFNLRDSTPLDSSSSRAWEKNKKAAAAVSEEDWRFLEWAYRQKEGAAAQFRRKDLATLLNNILTEVSRARDWAGRSGASVSATAPVSTEPDGWRDLIETEFPEVNLTTWALLPDSMKFWVREKQRELAAA